MIWNDETYCVLQIHLLDHHPNVPLTNFVTNSNGRPNCDAIAFSYSGRTICSNPQIWHLHSEWLSKIKITSDTSLIVPTLANSSSWRATLIYRPQWRKLRDAFCSIIDPVFEFVLSILRCSSCPYKLQFASQTLLQSIKSVSASDISIQINPWILTWIYILLIYDVDVRVEFTNSIGRTCMTNQWFKSNDDTTTNPFGRSFVSNGRPFNKQRYSDLSSSSFGNWMDSWSHIHKYNQINT